MRPAGSPGSLFRSKNVEEVGDVASPSYRPPAAPSPAPPKSSEGGSGSGSGSNPLSAVLMFHKLRALQQEHEHLSARASATQARNEEVARKNGWNKGGKGASRGKGGGKKGAAAAAAAGVAATNPGFARTYPPAPASFAPTAQQQQQQPPQPQKYVPSGPVPFVPSPRPQPFNPTTASAPVSHAQVQSYAAPPPSLPPQQQQQQQQAYPPPQQQQDPRYAAPPPGTPPRFTRSPQRGSPPGKKGSKQLTLDIYKERFGKHVVTTPPRSTGSSRSPPSTRQLTLDIYKDRFGGAAAAEAAAKVEAVPSAVDPSQGATLDMDGICLEDSQQSPPQPPPAKRRRATAAAQPQQQSMTAFYDPAPRAPPAVAAGAATGGAAAVAPAAAGANPFAPRSLVERREHVAAAAARRDVVAVDLAGLVRRVHAAPLTDACGEPRRVCLSLGVGATWLSDVESRPWSTANGRQPEAEETCVHALYHDGAVWWHAVDCRLSEGGALPALVGLLCDGAVEKVLHDYQNFMAPVCHLMKRGGGGGAAARGQRPQQVHDVRTMMWMLSSDERQSSLEEAFAAYGVFAGRDTTERVAAAGALAPGTAEVLSRLHRLRALHTALKKLVIDARLGPCFLKVECPVSWLLVEMHVEGFPIDLSVLQKSHLDQLEVMKDIEREAVAVSGLETFNILSADDIREVLFDKLKLDTQLGSGALGRTKKNNKVSTDKETLQALAPLHPLPGLILRYRAISKVVSTYIQNLTAHARPTAAVAGSASEQHRVHPQFNQEGTETGRLSCHSPNLQNQPRSEGDVAPPDSQPPDSQLADPIAVVGPNGHNVRCAFTALDASQVLVAVDYSQIELRVLAHLSNDPVLCGLLRAGGDLHRAVAARIFQKPDASVSKTERQMGKKVVFGVLYGQGAKALAKVLSVEVDEAGVFIQGFKRGFPTVASWSEGVLQSCRRTQAVRTFANRLRRLPNIVSRSPAERWHAERQAVNTVIQGSAADLIKIAMVNISQAETPYPITMMGQIHDEILASVPAAQVDHAVPLLIRLMEEAVTLGVPLVATASWGPSWGDLKPWTPPLV